MHLAPVVSLQAINRLLFRIGQQSGKSLCKTADLLKSD
jgi:hypothetical protein